MVVAPRNLSLVSVPDRVDLCGHLELKLWIHVCLVLGEGFCLLRAFIVHCLAEICTWRTEIRSLLRILEVITGCGCIDCWGSVPLLLLLLV